MYIQYIEIAKVVLSIHTEQELQCSDAFRPFVRSTARKSWKIDITSVSQLPMLSDKADYEDSQYSVYQREGNSVRRFFDLLDEHKVYAVAEMKAAKREVQIRYLLQKQKYLSEWNNVFFHIGWEQILSYENRVILHASCIQTPLGGILFSGVSGIGKSTQAKLWCKYAKSRLINGDRTIIGKEDGCWMGYGSPYAGSSRCWRDEKCKIRAIVMLRKANLCSIKKMSALRAFQQLFGGTTINNWDSGFVERVCDLELELVNQIPVYELYCTPNEEAVKLLWSVLEGGIECG